MHEIEQHQRSTAFTQTLVYSGIALQVLIVTVTVLLVVLRKCLRRRERGTLPVYHPPTLKIKIPKATTKSSEVANPRPSLRASFKSILNPKNYIPSAKID